MALDIPEQVELAADHWQFAAVSANTQL